ncbi:hypothetical protein TVAG_156770 [Trichomonas vaginalis G3]|uniref:Uncharacterized protein n=1 Tax=Trichomonas vaginalis (strain ATCC PRA-98 / G3) TaxID=412133 RepID=A2FZ63_TRIV3|nr:hypothetical protein TVAGG3_0454350 [Trichomonas vaginalis G3]EAX89797.1 hypothetical protein TVAG_156770 [Trichomonas vaginalis G3]KAI5538362.1 hypothetical protein TVAGG3_0454350 [Trichomonas vaginalis G3]|eukprot:XP_001302727.1 hypothetical protein [Trichomonas vaginalis G3]
MEDLGNKYLNQQKNMMETQQQQSAPQQMELQNLKNKIADESKKIEKDSFKPMRDSLNKMEKMRDQQAKKIVSQLSNDSKAVYKDLSSKITQTIQNSEVGRAEMAINQKISNFEKNSEQLDQNPKEKTPIQKNDEIINFQNQIIADQQAMNQNVVAKALIKMKPKQKKPSKQKENENEEEDVQKSMLQQMIKYQKSQESHSNDSQQTNSPNDQNQEISEENLVESDSDGDPILLSTKDDDSPQLIDSNSTDTTKYKEEEEIKDLDSLPILLDDIPTLPKDNEKINKSSDDDNQ